MLSISCIGFNLPKLSLATTIVDSGNFIIGRCSCNQLNVLSGINWLSTVCASVSTGLPLMSTKKTVALLTLISPLLFTDMDGRFFKKVYRIAALSGFKLAIVFLLLLTTTSFNSCIGFKFNN